MDSNFKRWLSDLHIILLAIFMNNAANIRCNRRSQLCPLIRGNRTPAKYPIFYRLCHRLSAILATRTKCKKGPKKLPIPPPGNLPLHNEGIFAVLSTSPKGSNMRTLRNKCYTQSQYYCNF